MTKVRAKSETRSTTIQWDSKEGYDLLNCEKCFLRQAEAIDIRNVILNMNRDGDPFDCLIDKLIDKSWSLECTASKLTYRQHWTEKLRFIREKDWLNKEPYVLSLRQRYHTSIAKWNIASSGTTDIQADNLPWLLKDQKEKSKLYDEELERSEQ